MRLLFDIFMQMLRTIWAHKVRSFLTMFGIAWGVGSLLLLVGLGEGFRSGNQRNMRDLGENVMFIWSGRAPAVAGSFTGLREYYLNDKDYEDIKHECPDVAKVAPIISRGDLRSVSDFNSAGGQVMGTMPVFNQIRNYPLRDGRWINEMDVEQAQRVAVLGDETRRQLFGGKDALGAVILINGVRFQVIGLVERIGHGENTNRNLYIIIPFTTMRQLFPVKVSDRPTAISFLNYQPRTRALHDQAKEEVHRVIGRNHQFDWRNKDAFDEWDTIKTYDMVGKIFTAMDMFLGSVGLVTLALGAIGTINIMLVAVAERTPEIGLRKALGATNRSIMFQFFAEGAFLTLISGGIGMGGAAGLMALLNAVIRQPPQGFDPPKLVASSAAVAIGSLALAGMIAGLYPATKAAHLQPVEALRKE
jgi:putative ABC transport system permease protein